MTQITGERVKELRTRQNLTQSDLAKKAKVDKQTIHRIETGRQKKVRPSTVKSLADALGPGVSTEVLACQEPLPDSKPVRARPSSDEDYSINVSVDGAVRNAFTLASRRYRVPIARIVDLAPFLFVLAAEGSLERRREIAKNLEEAFDQARSLVSSRPYHSIDYYWSYSDDALDSERRSISSRDLLGDTLSGQPSEYDESRDNPFVEYLEEAKRVNADVASIRSFDRDCTDFDVCREDALRLAGDDQELAQSIIDGEVMLHKMQRELPNDASVEARIAWLREKRDAYRAAIKPLTSPLDLLAMLDD